MEILRLETTDSTNSWIGRNEKDLSPTMLVYTMEQTAGRGQRGNTWESQPGKNITASLLFHPENFPAYRQFEISEAIALAICEFLKELELNVKIKWPNDIYVDDKKICGILVEHVVTGKNITRTIAGFGININQEKFTSEAPNPVSVCQLVGKEYDIDESVTKLAGYLHKNLQRLESEENFHSEFLDSLWRRDGNFYKFRIREGERMIDAQIDTVANDGTLHLIDRGGKRYQFAFKEIEFLL